MKKARINVIGALACWWQVPAWDFGVPGVAAFKRPEDPKATWNVIHLASGLAIVIGEPTRDKAIERFFRLPDVDWTLGMTEVLRDLHAAGVREAA